MTTQPRPDASIFSDAHLSRAAIFEIQIASNRYYDYQGTLKHPHSDTYADFGGILEMFQQMWDMLDRYNFPRATNRARHWGNLETTQEEKKDMRKKSSKNTEAPLGAPSFIVKVHYRQNTTWQGTIQWLERQQTLPFRSTLELIRLMDDVVSQCELPGGQPDGEENPDESWDL